MKQFHDYVKDHAERMPDKIALTISGRKITYRALDEPRLCGRPAVNGHRDGGE
ncbi:non-ribosomal peptide synthetase component E (peptide arylation enzyme) [Pseudomonas sp. BS3782 TE3695]|jgi:non-ribosomal peptide synthetase component E (peptide arylation enzyme)|uniref:hypothetical protein n=1 Tax=Pseudomonas sp. BS3782 TE3695 TaxID=3349323 RepID=UPI003D218C64